MSDFWQQYLATPDPKAAVDRAAVQYRRLQTVIEARWAAEGFKPIESSDGFRGDFDKINYIKPPSR